MENKINIAELLRDCPKGMELDCTTWENVTFEEVRNDTIIIVRNNKQPYVDTVALNKYGRVTSYEDEKCRIFPKGKTTWEGFVPPYQFNDGDILTYMYYNKPTIYIYRKNGCCNTSYYAGYSFTNGLFYKDKTGGLSGDRADLRLATEEEKAELFKAIKDNGYKWNAETKTLEKLTKFKIGDEIAKKNGISNSYIVSSVSCEFYGLRLPDNTGVGVLGVDDQDDWELISRVKPIFKKGDKVRVKKGFPEPRIARIIEDVGDTFYTLVSVGKINFTDQNNWELVPDKFDISKFKPFDQVLVRDFDSEVWEIDFFSKLLYGKHFKCHGASYVQCIPYKGNEHLHNSTNACNDYFKTWEK